MTKKSLFKFKKPLFFIFGVFILVFFVNHSFTIFASPLVAGIVTSAPAVLGQTDMFNPLIQGIKESYSKVLGQAIGLPDAGPSDDNVSNLPTSNKLSGQILMVPKLNLVENLYQGEVLGDQLLMGDSEILTASAFGKQIIYAHNDSSSFGFINQLKFDDEIVILENNNAETYKVRLTYWLSSGSVDVIEKVDPKAVVLITCDRFSPNLRVVVIAEK